MKIVADAHILDIESCFQDLGDLQLIPGREIKNSDLISADALFVRSITSVNEALLKNTEIKFIGSATSGTDHIDRRYLFDNNIDFSDAKGSNANAVVDYFFAAIAHRASGGGLNIQDSSVGIVGAGMVGGLLAKKLESLNISCRLCDPPLANAGLKECEPALRQYFPLEEVLCCDIVSLHVPLIADGEHPSKSLISSKQLALLPQDAMLINACRGGVVDETALLSFLKARDDVFYVCDVWLGEPSVNPELVAAAYLATPHIAGYSQEAKRDASSRMRTAFLDFLGKNSEQEAALVTSDSVSLISVEAGQNCWDIILQALPIATLSANFKAAVVSGAGTESFDAMRKALQQRHEFLAWQLEKPKLADDQLQILTALGFEILI